MPFIPHTAEEVQVMLSQIGVASTEDLFDEIPQSLRAGALSSVPVGVSELEMLGKLGARAVLDETGVCFAGAGCYDHHVPAAVWDLASRGEFMTAYTPYQAEASQGTLQLIYEYQSMMTELTGLDVSNASVYDGASGLAEAVLMAVRSNKKARSRTVLLPDSLHPHYAAAAHNICRHQNVEFAAMSLDDDGRVDIEALAAGGSDEVCAVVVQQPNFFGMLEDVDALTGWAAERGALVIAVVNPLALAVLKPPGKWGETGADIACGEGQPLGVPMSSGGPAFGFICCRSALVRQLPGRVIGRTEDLSGKPGFTLTLQAREQHIRRGKATSNICTNQGLLVTAATIHMSLMGPVGLARVAEHCHANTRALVEALTAIDGVEALHQGPYFHERVLRLPRPAEEVVSDLLRHGILGGVALDNYHEGMSHDLLVCATEKRTDADIGRYAAALGEVLAR
ncbi:MAG: aminomethyl-transferring glycine dehydrogenase subunit GcvPA [Pseudomonadales bacterium]|nr:aminomethyl-transferring glycine dehydrogenase subunit GcvPA [Pseudomonadales bacterium]NIX07052.1 aminomethyl-transferring glycine dehydrogenase subunit GcvPA [Pseudomonadales bacterium]